jgi:uncharacterized membrane protein
MLSSNKSQKIVKVYKVTKKGERVAEEEKARNNLVILMTMKILISREEKQKKDERVVEQEESRGNLIVLMTLKILTKRQEKQKKDIFPFSLTMRIRQLIIQKTVRYLRNIYALSHS